MSTNKWKGRCFGILFGQTRTRPRPDQDYGWITAVGDVVVGESFMYGTGLHAHPGSKNAFVMPCG